MKDCGKYRNLFEKVLYEEIPTSNLEEFNNHLNDCSACSREFNDLKELLNVVKLREREEPKPEFINNLWNNIEPQLKKTESPIALWWNNVKSFFNFEIRLPHQIAFGLTVLLLGIFIGRFMLRDDEIKQPIIATENKSTNQQIVQARAERYLDRSKVLLLGLINADNSSNELQSLNLTREQKISNELITEAADLKSSLKGSSNQQLQRLVAEVEIILLQIANLEIENDLSGIELIKDGVDRRGIFLKINIQEILNQNIKMEPDENSQSNKSEIKS